MTKLTKTIEEILDKCESPVQLPEQEGFSGGKEWAIHALIKSIKERDKEVLGEELDDLFCEIRGLLKEHSIFPEQWDTDERLRAWLKEKGEL